MGKLKQHGNRNETWLLHRCCCCTAATAADSAATAAECGTSAMIALFSFFPLSLFFFFSLLQLLVFICVWLLGSKAFRFYAPPPHSYCLILALSPTLSLTPLSLHASSWIVEWRRRRRGQKLRFNDDFLVKCSIHTHMHLCVCVWSELCMCVHVCICVCCACAYIYTMFMQIAAISSDSQCSCS